MRVNEKKIDQICLIRGKDSIFSIGFGEARGGLGVRATTPYVGGLGERCGCQSRGRRPGRPGVPSVRPAQGPEISP